MRHLSRSLCSLLFALAAAVATGSVAAAQTVWTDAGGAGGMGPFVSGLAAVSSTDIWEVGSQRNEAPTSLDRVLSQITHFDGTSWSNMSGPALPGESGLAAVAAVSSDDVWAVGWQNSSSRNYAPPQPVQRTLIEHWNGSAWSVVPSPNLTATTPNQLTAVSAVSAGDIWAVGSADTAPLIEHWDGVSWSIVTTPAAPAAMTLNGVAAVSSDDVWAVGAMATGPGSPDTQAEAEHWDGSAWSAPSYVQSFGATSALTAIAAVSASDIWVVGYSSDPGVPEGLSSHWNGTSWTSIRLPEPPVRGDVRRLYAVAAKGSDVWTAGSDSHPASGATHVMLHWNGGSLAGDAPSDGWKPVALSGATGDTARSLAALAEVAPTDVWAAGNDTEHYAPQPGDQTTSVALSSSPSPSLVGDPVTVTASVAAPYSADDPAGTVTLSDGATVLGTQALDAHGMATFTTSALTAGSHTLTASYAATAGFAGSSGGLTQSVVASPLATTTTLTGVDPGPWMGKSFDLTATVAGDLGTPPGAVTFRDGSTTLGTAPLDTQGHASWTVGPPGPVPPAGEHDFTATYNGSSAYTPSTSAAVAWHAVGDPTVTVTVSATEPGQTATLTATVSGMPGAALPTGQVRFFQTVVTTETTIGDAALDATGTASLSAVLPPGWVTIRALYLGDANYRVANNPSPVSHLTSWQLPARVLVATHSNPVTPTERISVGVEVDSDYDAIATGFLSMQIDGGTPFALSNPLDGTGGDAVVLDPLPAGRHVITVLYGGDRDYSPVSGSFIEQVESATPSTRFVNQLYNDILNRPADGGAAGWATALDQHHATRTQVALTLTGSSESVTDNVQATYLAHLGREADPDGLKYWVHYVQTGGTYEDLEVSFLGAREYYSAAGGSDDAFLDALYQDVFGRAIDDGGRIYWDHMLSTGTAPWQVAMAVVTSTEAMSNRVTAAYRGLLGRDPDKGGLAHWVDLLLHGTRDEQMIAYLAGSDEYWNLSQLD